MTTVTPNALPNRTSAKLTAFLRHRLVIAWLMSAVLLYLCLYSYHVIFLTGHFTECPRLPFLFDGFRRITYCGSEASAAGLNQGDVVEAIAGSAFTGERVFHNVIRNLRASDKLRLNVITPGGWHKTVLIQLQPIFTQKAGARDWFFYLFVYLLVPWFCFLFGAFVLIVRFRDPIAWILFALTASFSSIVPLNGWQAPLHLYGILFQDWALNTFGIWILLLGIRFPPHSELDRNLPFIKWTLIGPLVLACLLTLVSDTVGYFSFHPVEQLRSVTDLIGNFTLLLSVTAILLFFLTIGLKIRRTSAADQRRRLNVLLTGSTVSLIPISLLTLVGIVRGRYPLDAPGIFVIPAILTLCLFPCTLAYVIVVRRALDVRVILHQGVKYSLARQGVLAIRCVAVVTIFGFVLYAVDSHKFNQSEQFCFIILAGLVMTSLQFPFFTRLDSWVDRHFFRESYDADQVLRAIAIERLRTEEDLFKTILDALTATLHIKKAAGLTKVAQGLAPNYLIGHSAEVDSSILEDGPMTSYLAVHHHPRLVDVSLEASQWDIPISDSECRYLRLLDAEVLIPLFDGSEIIGLIILGPKRSEQPYTPSEISLFRNLATQASLALTNSLLLSKLEAEAFAQERKQAAAQAAEQANLAKSEFLARMSHELRTPLNAIIGYSEMLTDLSENLGLASFVKDLGRIRSAGKHLVQLINSILDISKIEAGKMELFLETFSIQKLVSDVEIVAQPLVKQNGNTLVLDIPSENIFMRTDQGKLRQVLINLMSNAAKFTQNGAISLTVRHELNVSVNQMIFTISDSGIGIAPDQIGKLFQPFSQADASSQKYGGTGLGLAICKRLCELMGGAIGVVSEVGKGTTFNVLIPTQAGKTQEPAEVVKESKTDPVVLVIDDDPIAQDLIRRSLAREGFQSVSALTGEDGLRLAKEIRPDVITLDVLMPGMDGWNVLSHLKSSVELASIPLIMITIVDEKKRGFALGAHGYLVKPVGREQLTPVLTSLRSATENANRSALVIDDEEINRRNLCQLLQKDGWRVRDAQDGQRALACIEQETPDLILLDLVMPGMDGFSFLQEIKKIDSARSIPVVVVTAKDLTQDELKHLETYATSVLKAEGYNRDKLLAEVNQQVASRLKRRSVLI